MSAKPQWHSDPLVREALVLTREFLGVLRGRFGNAVRAVHCEVSSGRVRLALVVPPEFVDVVRALIPRHSMLSTVRLVHGVVAPPAPLPLTEEERGFLDFLIDSALESWIHAP